eukprot:1385352-Rhodomonas_salina.1
MCIRDSLPPSLPPSLSLSLSLSRCPVSVPVPPFLVPSPLPTLFQPRSHLPLLMLASLPSLQQVHGAAGRAPQVSARVTPPRRPTHAQDIALHCR